MTTPTPPTNGTDERLDLVIDELRAIRGLLTPVAPAVPEDGEPIELREPHTVDPNLMTPAPPKRKR